MFNVIYIVERNACRCRPPIRVVRVKVGRQVGGKNFFSPVSIVKETGDCSLLSNYISNEGWGWGSIIW